MILHNYINEAKELSLDRNFSQALLQVFSLGFLKKIESKIDKNIKIKSKDFKNPGKAAYTIGKTIYINEPIFERLSNEDKTKFLLHEFMHIMQNRKNYFIFKTFKEIYELGNTLFEIVKKNKKNDISIFLTGRKQKLNDIKFEIIPYLMNNNIDWSAISDKGKSDFIMALDKSGLFNIRSSFWRERLK